MLMEVPSIHTFGQIERIISEAPARSKLYRDQAFQQLLFEHLDRAMPSNNAVLSLDIFDTLVLRDNSSELSRFLEIGASMASLVDGREADALTRFGLDAPPSKQEVDAFLARHLGTKVSYRARDRVKGYGEGSLTQIHTVSSRLLTGSDGYRDRFIAAELAYEATRIKPNPALLRYIDKHLSRGGRVILVTDMYMHVTQVEALLKSINMDLKKFHRIFSSADAVVSKASGLLFSEIEEHLALNKEDFVHVGDSLRGDFRQPMERGWKAVHLPVSEREVAARKADHLRTAAMLEEHFLIEVDIAIPA